MRSRIVAIYSFTSESGKDTACDIISDWLTRNGIHVTRSAFADEMKIVCADALGIAGDRAHKILEIDRLKLSNELGMVNYQRMICPRHPDSGIMYSPGQQGRNFIIGLAESIRRLDKTFWIRHAAPMMRPEDHVHLISDLRFLPEEEWVHEQNGLVFEIQRDDTTHRNEDLVTTDGVIDNNSDLKALRERCEQLAARLIAT